MGWDLFRRKTLICLIILAAVFTFDLFPQSLPLRFNRDHKSAAILRSAFYPSQGHAAPEIFFFPVTSNEAIDKELKVYSGKVNFLVLKNIFVRSKLYRNFIISEIEKRRLPPELLFIPFIESNYNPKALSRSGAAGLWQLMRVCAAGRRLVIDEWLDERYDFWKSTQVALDVLRDLYAHYDDWLLALAAYNCGMTRLDLIIKNSGTKDFWELRSKNLLPQETACYVARILAVIKICSYPGRNSLPRAWDKDVVWQRIALPGPVDLRKLASLSGVAYEVLLAGNRELTSIVTPPPAYKYQLKVQEELAGPVQNALLQSKDKLIRFYIHTVYSGESLSAVARYYSISKELIIYFNPHVSAANFQIGMKLVIPVIRDSIAPAGPARNFTGRQFTNIHLVKQGDTLFGIARDYGIPVEELLYHNALTLNSIIKAGERLKVPYK